MGFDIVLGYPGILENLFDTILGHLSTFKTGFDIIIRYLLRNCEAFYFSFERHTMFTLQSVKTPTLRKNNQTSSQNHVCPVIQVISTMCRATEL